MQIEADERGRVAAELAERLALEKVPREERAILGAAEHAAVVIGEARLQLEAAVGVASVLAEHLARGLVEEAHLRRRRRGVDGRMRELEEDCVNRWSHEGGVNWRRPE